MSTPSVLASYSAQKSYQQFFLLALMFIIVMMMIVPVPTGVLDLLLAMNLSFSALLLFYVLSVSEPLELSIFPSLLLVTTLFRLALNVSTTRSILMHGYAGEMIQAFGEFVVGSNYVVGAIIFVILVVIQFVVITKGAERVSEVAARFTLDAMPGKQMSIDADLNAGMITEEEARRQRMKIRQEADFYGAMDGASKFIKGDAIAGIIITLVNVFGGFIVGVVQQGMSFQDAVTTYTILSIGDGLVAQIPSLIISVAAGILVTKASTTQSLSDEVGKQLTAYPQVTMIAGGMIAGLGFIPGLPFVPLCLIGVTLATMGYRMKKRSDQLQRMKQDVEQKESSASRLEKISDVTDFIGVDKLELEFGFHFVPLATSEKGNLSDRIMLLRRQIAQQLGIIVPPLRMRDNPNLPPNRYVFRLKGIEIASYDMYVDRYLVMGDEASLRQIEGIPTREPAFNLPAKWVKDRKPAEKLGCTVIDAPTVMITHIDQLIKRHAHEILGRDDVQKILDKVKASHPALVDDLIPAKLSVGTVQKVLCRLLKEQVSVRDIVTILETLADQAEHTKDPLLLTEWVRKALKRQITMSVLKEDGTLDVVTLDMAVQNYLIENMDISEFGVTFRVRPGYLEELVVKTVQTITQAQARGDRPVLLVHPRLRPHLRELLEEHSGHDITVLSFNEIDTSKSIREVGRVTLESENI